jgi:toxin YoeB
MLFLKPLAKEHIKYWKKVDPKKEKKILALMDSITLDPTEGIGKPERLKYKVNTWSRHIDQEHRLIYEIHEDKVVILSAKGHCE